MSRQTNTECYASQVVQELSNVAKFVLNQPFSDAPSAIERPIAAKSIKLKTGHSIKAAIVEKFAENIKVISAQ